MHADNGWASPWFRASLLLLLLLTSCATPSGKLRGLGTYGSPHASNSPPRILKASSDSPPSSGTSSTQNVQGYNVPGRNPDSQAPWEFFLGNAAHRLIAYIYGANNPQNSVFYNNKTITDILITRGIGNPSRLLSHERNLRPDITDVTDRTEPYVFEIKPWNGQGLLEGRRELQMHLAALNRAAAPGTHFIGGMGFQGQILIRFAQGQHIWRLEWQTTEPGIIQYRWTRSQQRFKSERAAYEAGQWVDLTVEEMRQYGGWVGQAVEGMVTRREQLATARGAISIVITIIGETARGAFTGAILGRMSPGAGTQQPPTQGGGKVIPFPSRPPASAPPAKPAAAANGL